MPVRVQFCHGICFASPNMAYKSAPFGCCNLSQGLVANTAVSKLVCRACFLSLMNQSCQFLLLEGFYQHCMTLLKTSFSKFLKRHLVHKSRNLESAATTYGSSNLSILLEDKCTCVFQSQTHTDLDHIPEQGCIQLVIRACSTV